MTDHLERALDLRRADLDPEAFAAALAVRYVRRLIVHGGSENGRPNDQTALRPHLLERFLARALETAHQAQLFEQEWRRLQQVFPRMQVAWEKGQALFHEDLARAMDQPEEMEYLSMIDFAVDCYACVKGTKIYLHNQALQNWAINGYMLAWRQHFLTKEGSSEREEISYPE